MCSIAIVFRKAENRVQVAEISAGPGRNAHSIEHVARLVRHNSILSKAGASDKPGAVHWAPNNTQLLPTSRAQSSLSPCRRQEKVNMTFWERRERNLAKDFLE